MEARVEPSSQLVAVPGPRLYVREWAGAGWLFLLVHGLARSRLKWFEDTDHDIHVHKPVKLAEWILQALEDGFFE